MPDVVKQPVHFARLIHKGESLVASIGISLAAIMMLAMGAAAWWTWTAQRDAATQLRVAEVQRSAEMLSQSAQTMLSSNDLSGLRTLLADAARNSNFQRCQIILPGGGVIADSTPAGVTQKKLPQTWTAGNGHAGGEFGNGVYSYNFTVPGRGGATLRITPGSTTAASSYWQTQAGLGAIGAAALVALLIVYRRLRQRLRAVGAIGEALIALTHGESDMDALTVAQSLGAEAEAWNQLLAEKQQFHQQQATESYASSLQNRREGKGHLEAACDALSQGMLLIDERMNIKFANGAAGAFLGSLKEKLPGKGVESLVNDEQVVKAIKGIAAGDSRQRATVEWERRGEAGFSVLRFVIRPVRKEDGAAAMIIIEDLTQQRVAEEARNSFIAQATHELRAPLTNMRMYIESAIEDGEEDAAVRAKCLNIINLEARRLERIVGEMLSISEIEAGAFTVNRADLYSEQLFTELQEDYAEQAVSKEIKLVFNLPPKLPAIKGDRDKIMVALHNLLSNALKYTPRGGQITVTADVKQDLLYVEVADTGIGISDEDQEHVFDKFARAHDPRVEKITGTGLGLTLAREVVQLHGGTLTLQSELNKGSTFTMTLPAAQAA